MNQPLELQIREHIVDYLVGNAKLGDFNDWLASVLWDIDASGEPNAIKMGYAAELLISEFTAGHWKLSEFKRRLQELVSLPTTSPHSGYRWTPGKLKRSSFFVINSKRDAGRKVVSNKHVKPVKPRRLNRQMQLGVQGTSVLVSLER